MPPPRPNLAVDSVGINLPNLISLGRLLLVPLAIWLILRSRYGVAFWIFVVAGVSDALDGFIAKHFNRRTQLGALLDPIADKTLLVSVYVALGWANQLWTSVVILVVFRDVMIIGGFLLIQAFAAQKHYDPLYISKINTGLQIALIAFVLARLGRGADWGNVDVVLSCAVIVTTVLSGLSYILRWTRILSRSEQVW
jgi:cardiolipin synthase (CMP-forming)